MCFLPGKKCNILISNVGPDTILEAVLLHPFRFFFRFQLCVSCEISLGRKWMKEVWLSTPCDLIHKEISEPESIAKTSTTSDLQLHSKSEPTTYSFVT